jgi:hypothetical protein
VTFQVENLVLNGVDDVADGISALALSLFAAVDGRPPSSFDEAKSPAARTRTGAKSATKATSRAAATRAAGSPTTATRPVATRSGGGKPAGTASRSASKRSAH